MKDYSSYNDNYEERIKLNNYRTKIKHLERNKLIRDKFKNHVIDINENIKDINCYIYLSKAIIENAVDEFKGNLLRIKFLQMKLYNGTISEKEQADLKKRIDANKQIREWPHTSNFAIVTLNLDADAFIEQLDKIEKNM